MGTCEGQSWLISPGPICAVMAAIELYTPQGAEMVFRNDVWALWAGVIMRLEHHLVGGYVRYISPHIIILLLYSYIFLGIAERPHIGCYKNNYQKYGGIKRRPSIKLPFVYSIVYIWYRIAYENWIGVKLNDGTKINTSCLSVCRSVGRGVRLSGGNIVFENNKILLPIIYVIILMTKIPSRIK